MGAEPRRARPDAVLRRRSRVPDARHDGRRRPRDAGRVRRAARAAAAPLRAADRPRRVDRRGDAARRLAGDALLQPVRGARHLSRLLLAGDGDPDLALPGATRAGLPLPHGDLAGVCRRDERDGAARHRHLHGVPVAPRRRRADRAAARGCAARAPRHALRTPRPERGCHAARDPRGAQEGARTARQELRSRRRRDRLPGVIHREPARGVRPQAGAARGAGRGQHRGPDGRRGGGGRARPRRRVHRRAVAVRRGHAAPARADAPARCREPDARHDAADAAVLRPARREAAVRRRPRVRGPDDGVRRRRRDAQARRRAAGDAGHARRAVRGRDGRRHGVEVARVGRLLGALLRRRDHDVQRLLHRPGQHLDRHLGHARLLVAARGAPARRPVLLLRDDPARLRVRSDRDRGVRRGAPRDARRLA